MRPRRTVYRNAEIPGLIQGLRPFLSEGKLPDGTRRWSAYGSAVLGYGHLPARLRASVDEAVYVVYSYDTPIAWVTEDGRRRVTERLRYHVPAVGYSPTTGQHQYACLDAWRDEARGGLLDRHGRREVVRVPGNAEVYGRTIRARSGGMDGVRPGEAVGRGYSAYADTGDDASHWSPGPNAPGGYGPWERPGDWGWHPAAHP